MASITTCFKPIENFFFKCSNRTREKETDSIFATSHPKPGSQSRLSVTEQMTGSPSRRLARIFLYKF